MRNKTIRVAVVGAMLVSFALTVSPAQARDRRPEGSRNRGTVSLLAQLGGFLWQWAEGLAGAAAASVDSSSAAKTASAPPSGTPVRAAETSASTDRSAAIDPWGVR